MEKILIATKNKDKFEIVTKILNKINNVSYEYYSLYDIKNLEKSGRKPHWRFKLSREKIKFDDLIHGEITFDLGSVSDPVIRKADGDFTYTFASCVDDVDIGISHIIRGDDHVSNTASQIEIFKDLRNFYFV